MSESERRLNERVLTGQKQGQTRSARPSLPASVERAWQAVGWFGLALMLAGLADVVMVWFPSAFGNPTWEFGSVDVSFSSLPLLTMGLAALTASAFARQITWRLWLLGVVLIVLGLTLISMYVVFYGLNIPLALRATAPELKVGILKSIAKTTILTVLFPIAYVAVGIAALRNAKPSRG